MCCSQAAGLWEVTEDCCLMAGQRAGGLKAIKRTHAHLYSPKIKKYTDSKTELMRSSSFTLFSDSHQAAACKHKHKV